jgi:hypothetical protein
MRTILSVFLLTFSVCAPALADEQVGPGDSRPKRSAILNVLEGTFNVVSAYHAQAIPHELVHVGAASAFGTHLTQWNWKPLLESVEYDHPIRKRLGGHFLERNVSTGLYEAHPRLASMDTRTARKGLVVSLDGDLLGCELFDPMGNTRWVLVCTCESKCQRGMGFL